LLKRQPVSQFTSFKPVAGFQNVSPVIKFFARHDDTTQETPTYLHCC